MGFILHKELITLAIVLTLTACCEEYQNQNRPPVKSMTEQQQYHPVDKDQLQGR